MREEVQEGDSYSAGCGRAVTQMCVHIAELANWSNQGTALAGHTAAGGEARTSPTTTRSWVRGGVKSKASTSLRHSYGLWCMVYNG